MTGVACLLLPPVPATAAEADRSRRRDRWAWGFVALLLLFQWALLRQYITRELEGHFPRFFDQTVYLESSYQAHQTMLSRGFLAGLGQGLESAQANGLLLPVQASVLYLLFGPSRLTALGLLFVYFAAFQVVLVATLRWRSGRWSVAFYGLGLLLTAAAPYAQLGGLTDFRIDCVAFSLFGIVLCLVVRSGFFASWRWSLAAGAAAAVLVLFRFLAAAYLGGILAVWWLFLAARYALRRSDPGAREVLSRQLLGALLAGLVLAALAGPALFWKRHVLWSYYVVNFVLGGDRDVRVAETGITTRAQFYLYYARSVYQSHAGPLFLVLAAAGVLAAVLARRRGAPAARDTVSAWSFLGASLLVPYVLLTWSVSKSPVVGSILVPPLLWLALRPVLRLAGARGGRLVLTGLACAALLCGLHMQLNAACRRGFADFQRGDAEQVLALYDEVLRRCADTDLRAGVLCCDCISEFANASALRVSAYERRGFAPDLRQGLATSVLRLDESLVRASVKQSDFIILAEDDSPVLSLYPFHAQMRELRGWLRDYCSRERLLAGRYVVQGTAYELYARPAVRVTGDSFGWITSRGLTVVGAREALAKKPTVCMSGTIDLNWLGQAPGVSVLLQREEGEEPVPATLRVAGDRYFLRFTVDPGRLPKTALVTLAVRFDRYFLFKAPGRHEYARKLVAGKPDKVVLTH